MSAESIPVHWLCLGSNTEQLFHHMGGFLWNQRGVCAPGHLPLYVSNSTEPIFDELNSSQALLTLFTRPWGEMFCPALFFPDPKMMLRVQPIPISWREFPWCERFQNHLGFVLSSLLARGDGSGQETKRSQQLACTIESNPDSKVYQAGTSHFYFSNPS